MKFSLRHILLGICLLSTCNVFSDTALVTTFNANLIYSFDTNNTNTPATTFATPVGALPDMIASSPDGKTVYFTTGNSGDVYSFPSNNPSVITKLNTGLGQPLGIAISSDGTLGFVAQDFGTIGLFSFPTAGSTHTATQLTPIGTTIARPLFIAISGNNGFVGDINNSTVYSVTFTATTYNATLVQSISGGGHVGGLAISSDGFLYISEAFNNQIVRVPVNNPTATPTVVATTTNAVDGLSVSNDGKTVYFTEVSNGVNAAVYSFPTTGSFPASVTTLSALNIPQAIDIVILPNPPPPSPDTPPTKSTGIKSSVFKQIDPIHPTGGLF